MPSQSAEGTLRAATTCLRLHSNVGTLLRQASPAVAGADGEQLGLGAPLFNDTPLWPAAWRRLGQTRELLVGAPCIAKLTGTDDALAAEVLFESAVGIVVEGILYTIQDNIALVADGTPCAYRLVLEGPARK